VEFGIHVPEQRFDAPVRQQKNMFRYTIFLQSLQSALSFDNLVKRPIFQIGCDIIGSEFVN
jgi:hypothetical protein